ncbi:MAG: glycosyltransferase family 2 protein [Planctomycetota bacterium]
MTATPISACLISFDEADRLAECLASLAFCDEIVVVDSHSKDATRAIAAAHGARVIERDWPGFGPQKRFAVEAARNDWVLCLDCDERLSPELADEIRGIQLEARAERGYTMPRTTAYLGRWIRHGGWYPDRQLRLFDRRHGNWNEAPVHERVEVTGPVGELAGDLLHVAYRDYADHQRTIERYTTLMAAGLHARGKRASALDLITHPVARFVRFYLLKAGFRDGWRGLLIALLAAQYAFQKYAKLLVLERETPLESDERTR